MFQAPQNPPPAMTGFTVSDGFSVVPPKRPTPVTAASAVLFVVAGSALIAGFGFIIIDFLANRNVLDVLFHTAFWHGALLLVVAAASTAFAFQVRTAVSNAQLGTYTVLGTVSVLYAATAFGYIAQALAGETGARGPMLVFAAILLVAAALAATPVVLLTAPSAAGWFRRRRRDVLILDQPTAPTRPVAATVAVAFTALTGLLVIANIATRSGWWYSGPRTTLGMESEMVNYLAELALPALVILAVTVGLAFANEFARVAAYGVCGYYCFHGASTFTGFVFTNDVMLRFGWIFYLDLLLTVLASIAAAIAVVALSQQDLIRWLDHRAEPVPTGQE